MKIKLIILSIVSLVITSCTTAEIVHPVGGSASAYAPSNETQRPGMVKYLNQGVDFVIKSRREDAYKKMYESCGGSYKIVNEGPQAEGGAMVPVGNTYFYSQSNYWYISFQCVNERVGS